LNEGRPLGRNYFRGVTFDILDDFNRRRDLSESDGKDSATDAATMDGEEEEQEQEQEQEQEERDLQDTIVIINDDRRGFNNNNNNRLYTVFAPTNAAFNSIGFDVIDFILLDTNIQLNFVQYIVEFHILKGREIRYGDLGCGSKYLMLNGANSRTECRGSNRKFQVGNGNRELDGFCRFNVPIISINNNLVIPNNNNAIINNRRRCLETYPEIIAPRNLLGTNGLVHSLDDVMIPYTIFFPSTPNPAGPIIINTPSPTDFPTDSPSSSPTVNDRCCPGQNLGDPQCISTIAFIYTQESCDPNSRKMDGELAMPGFCVDYADSQPQQMRFELTQCVEKFEEVANVPILYEAGDIKVGQQFSFTASNLVGFNNACLPKCIQVGIVNAENNVLSQLFNIDTSCNDNIACGYPVPNGGNTCPNQCPRRLLLGGSTCGEIGQNGCPDGVGTDFCNSLDLEGINGVGVAGFNTGSLQLSTFQCPEGVQGYPGGSLTECGKQEGAGTTCPTFCARGESGFCGY
jgi:uncharacterized surface protein with fasciclin (FAS1) repeats